MNTEAVRNGRLFFVPRGTLHNTVFRLIFRRRRVFVPQTIKYTPKTEKRVLRRLNGEFRNVVRSH